MFTKLSLNSLHSVLNFLPGELSLKWFLVISFSLFALATSVRLLHWQNNLHTVDNTMSSLAARYKDEARPLLNGDLRSFVQGNSTEPDQGILIHPPGYPIVLALTYKLSGYSDTGVRLIQILLTAFSAVVVFCIAVLILPRGAAIIAGLMVAVSPQFANTSLPLLPDFLSILAILVALYLLVRAWKKPRLIRIIAAGSFIGVSCWLRANALLLAPFLVLLIVALFPKRSRLRYSLALVAAAIVVTSPITLRNAIVFRSFIPVSLGSGIILIEGIADYDTGRIFGFESYDHLNARQEAVMYGRPDYADDLFRRDGIERERKRIKRALSVIASNKLWFMGVMIRRAASMVVLENTSVVSVEPTVTNSIKLSDQMEPIWSIDPSKLTDPTAVGNSSQAILDGDQHSVLLISAAPDAKKPVLTVLANVPLASDLLLRVPVKLNHGRMVLRVEKTDDGRILGSATIPDSLEPDAPKKDSMTYLQLPFVNAGDAQLRISLIDVNNTPSSLQVGEIEVYRLGTASYLWTKYPRWLLKGVQKFFKTRWMLPLTILGLLLLALKRRWIAIAFILAVPAYYINAHSPLHVEPRYVIVIHHFFFMLAAVALYTISAACWRVLWAINLRVQ